MDWNLIKELLKLHPAKLNIALLLLGVVGMLWAYNKGQDRINELQVEMRNMSRENRIEKDSILRVSQINEAKCTERLLDGQKSLIARIDLLNQELNDKLEKRDEADDRRFKQATANKNKAIKNTKNLLKTLQ